MFPTITDRKIRLAVVGCGRIAKNHFGSLEKHAEYIELTGICDNNPETLKSHQDTYKVPGFSRMEDMLREVKPDVVALCTPSGLHPDEAILAARHGVHVITEKPMDVLVAGRLSMWPSRRISPRRCGRNCRRAALFHNP